ncbi:MAG: transposase [Caldilineaceae bacterium]|jgi:hypothetical protein
MSKTNGIESWQATVREKLPQLSKPQAIVLGLWSFGMVMTQSCGLTTVSSFIAGLQAKKEDSVRQRLREWYMGAEEKKGTDREEIDVSDCFCGLVVWVLSWWASNEKRLAMVMDASSLGERFVVLAISIVCRGCAIPVAWVVVKAAEKGQWQPHWERLFAHLQGAVPADWLVIVLADRGLYAAWLYRLLVNMKWHPFLRINKTGTFCKAGSSQFLPLTMLLPRTNQAWSGKGHCFKSNPVACTLLACWDDKYQDPWLVMTDLAPDQADVCWYSMRSWIETGFKHSKRAGWQWQSTKMTDPERATRLWLAIAVATLWVVSVGNQAEDLLPLAAFAELPLTHIARRVSKRSKPRLLACFRRGILAVLTALLNALALPLGYFKPAPWPTLSPNLSQVL